MATFAAVISTSAPSNTTVYARVLTGTVGSATTSVARTAMTAEVTVGSTSVWSLAVASWDTEWVNARVVIDDGTACWCEGVTITNVVQGAGRSMVPESGNGAEEVTLTITSDGLPVADADVWITANEAGTQVVAGTRQTDSQGQVTFLLNDGVTYFLFWQKDGYEPILGEEFIAVAD